MHGILFDLDGVFYVGDAPVPQAAEVLAWAQNREIPYRFITNTTSRSRSTLVEKLADLGVGARQEEIFTPAVAAARWIRSHLRGEVALFVPPSTRGEFAGLQVADDDIEDTVDAVVLGDLGERWDFATLNHAFRLLMQRPPPKFIALGMTRYWLTPDGLQLDVGAFAAALHYASGQAPLVLGKPAAEFFHTAVAALECEPGDVVMVGDDIHGDIAAAQAAGLKAVLVKTGKFRPEDLDGTIRPDGLIDSVAGLPAWWTEQANRG